MEFSSKTYKVLELIHGVNNNARSSLMFDIRDYIQERVCNMRSTKVVSPLEPFLVWILYIQKQKNAEIVLGYYQGT